MNARNRLSSGTRTRNAPRLALPALLALTLGLGSMGPVQTALACGGCFVQPSVSSPIVQEAERVLFVRDAQSGESTIWVEIRYNGPAADFGWVLPLPKAPKQVGVGTSYLFDRLELGTAPRFVVQSGPSENCNAGGSGGFGCAMSDDVGSAARADGGGQGGGNVQVLQHDQVGPYDYQIIQSNDAADIQKWLSDRGFATPASAVPVLQDHVQNGFVFVAVKLAQGKSAKEIRPIALTLPEVEPCVPLRLTSIAAVNDTLVQVHVAGPGRAVPKNHLHVRLNPVRFNWFDGGSNYGQVLAAAIDEAAGRAFVTEFAGPPPQKLPLVGEFGQVGEEDLIPAEALQPPAWPNSTTACALLQDLRQSRFPITTETTAILEGVLGLATAAGQSDVEAFYKDGDCSAVSGQQVDAKAAREALQEDFCGPLKATAKLLQSQAKLTRLAMRISPDEMTKDPVFAFHPSLPNVSRDWEATSNIVCSSDGFSASQYRLTLQGVGSWRFAAPASGQGVPQQFGPDLPITSADPRFANAPAALSVELLDEQGPVVPIAPGQIALVDSAIANAREGQPQLPANLVLQDAPARYTPPASDPRLNSRTSADACAGGRRPAHTAAVVLGAAIAAVWLRRRRAAI